MIENETAPTILARIRWWLYAKCFAYCIHFMHPEADPAEFCFLDMVSFVAVSKDELREVMDESPDSAWRFEGMLQ